MNAGISTGATPVYEGDFGLGRTLPLMAVFVIAGVALIYVGLRYLKRHAPNHHRRFTKKS